MAAPRGWKATLSVQREEIEPLAVAGLWEFARIAGREILSATIVEGKPNCCCSRGRLHGPFIVRRWREGGRQRKTLVHADEVLAVLANLSH